MKINELIIAFEIGMIIEVLMKESLRQAFAFSLFFGMGLFLIFSVYKFADYYEVIESIEDFVEDIRNNFF